jgi:hypothetical protein
MINIKLLVKITVTVAIVIIESFKFQEIEIMIFKLLYLNDINAVTTGWINCYEIYPCVPCANHITNLL